jgi:general secretion pathway protein E/type IV pilus assembly protein PilB
MTNPIDSVNKKDNTKEPEQKRGLFGRSIFSKSKSSEESGIFSSRKKDAQKNIPPAPITENLMSSGPKSLMDSAPKFSKAPTPTPPENVNQNEIPDALEFSTSDNTETEIPQEIKAEAEEENIPKEPEKDHLGNEVSAIEDLLGEIEPSTLEMAADMTINDEPVKVYSDPSINEENNASITPESQEINNKGEEQGNIIEEKNEENNIEEEEKTEQDSISLFESSPSFKETLSPYELQQLKEKQQKEEEERKKAAAAEEAPSTEEHKESASKLGERMIELGLISEDQLHVALRDQREGKQMLGEVMVHHGFVTEATLTEVLSDSSGYERFDLEKAVIDTSLLNTVPQEIATNYRIFPVSLKDDVLYLAMADVYDIFAIDQVRRFFPSKIEITPLISSDKEIAACIQKYFGYELSIDGLLSEIEGGEKDNSPESLDDIAVANGDFSHPVVRLVNSLLLDAIKVGASDMHLEPEGNYLRIRYRIDGEMRQIRSLHKSHWSSIANRLKIMGNMDVANRIEAQDGRIQMMIGNSSIDFRVSSLPTIHGENFVLRVLDKSTAQVALQQLGFSDKNYELLQKLIAKPEGIIIVTGPTGSGKTTTLYAILNFLNSIDVNIMTLEDPVEYELPLIRQCQVREGSTVDFEHGIKALLRQDPDIILIGEVRNQITAIQTLRAAMTGHQVFTTLHTNSAVGAFPRLTDLGIHAELMAGNIVGVLGQRLSRKLCPHCKEMKPMTEEEAKQLMIPHDPSIMIGHKVGCPECGHIGLKGRVAIAEIMPMTKELGEMLATKETTESIRRAAVKHGFKPMANDALEKILEGTITIESALKVIDMGERLEC